MPLSAADPLHYNVDVLDGIYPFPFPLLETKNPVQERIQDVFYPVLRLKKVDGTLLRGYL